MRTKVLFAILSMSLLLAVLLSVSLKAYSGSMCRRVKRILSDARRGGGKTGTVRFHPPTAIQYKTLKTAAMRIERNEACSQQGLVNVSEMLAPVGFDLLRVGKFLIVREQKNARRGGGIYVYNCQATVPLVVQVPHSFYDLKTLDLGFKLFCSTNARWLMVNTLHRYRGYPNETATGPHPADVAHNENTIFQAITEGIASVAQPLFVQLHGFETRTDTDAEFIISSGSETPQECAKQVFKHLQKTQRPGVLYSKEHANLRLGGTTNVQGRLLRTLNGRFVHIEMSKPFRTSLLNDANVFKTLQEALIGAAHDCRR